MSRIQVEEIQDSVFDAEGCGRDKQTHEERLHDRCVTYRTLNRTIAEGHRATETDGGHTAGGLLLFSCRVDEHELKRAHDADDDIGEAVGLPDEVEDIAAAKAEHLCGCW